LLKAPYNFLFSSSSSASSFFLEGFLAIAEAPPASPSSGGSIGAI